MRSIILFMFAIFAVGAACPDCPTCQTRVLRSGESYTITVPQDQNKVTMIWDSQIYSDTNPFTLVINNVLSGPYTCWQQTEAEQIAGAFVAEIRCPQGCVLQYKMNHMSVNQDVLPVSDVVGEWRVKSCNSESCCPERLDVISSSGYVTAIGDCIDTPIVLPTSDGHINTQWTKEGLFIRVTTDRIYMKVGQTIYDFEHPVTAANGLDVALVISIANAAVIGIVLIIGIACYCLSRNRKRVSDLP